MILKVYSAIVPEEERQFMQFFGLDGTSFNSIDEFIAGIPEDDGVIDMRINSPGGVVSEGWAIIDKLRATGKKIVATIEGQASSMAAILLLAASERKGYKHATLLIHDAFYCNMYLEKGTAEELEKRAALLREDNERALDFMVERTGTDRETLEALMKEDLPVNMQKAMELGFVHEILEPVSASAARNPNRSDMDNKKTIASAFKAFAEALGLSIKMETEEPAPAGYVLTTQDGTELTIDKPEGEDPAVGDKASPDGEHLMPDGTTIVVTDGVITEIRDAEPEPEPEPEPSPADEAHAAELAAKDAEITALQARIAEFEAGQMSAEQSEILASVEKAGGKDWLDKTLQSNYTPAKRQRTTQTVQTAGNQISEDLKKARERKAAKRGTSKNE